MKCQPPRPATERDAPSTSGGKRRARPKADAVAARVRELIGPLCSAEAMELVHVEYRREAAGRVLRLYIDKPGGVRVDDCAMISRQAGDYLDVALGLEEAYRLEVSSPGTERPLVRAEDFERFKGRSARIRTREPADGRRNYKGVLSGMSDGVVHLSVGGDTFHIPFSQIEKATLAE